MNATCAICEAPLGRTLLEIVRPDRFERAAGVQEDGYWRRWRECPRCGAASDVRRPEDLARLEALATAYSEVDFRGSSIGEKYRRVMSLPEGKSDNVARVRRVREFASGWLSPCARRRGPSRLLDIGAGTGVFLARFLAESARAADSWSAVAVEPDPTAAEHLRGLGRFDVVEGLFERQPGLREFDLCTLNKVVEHVAEPLVLLRAVRDAVRAESGLLYVEVPDVLTIGWRPATDNILGALHHHLYGPVSLGILLERAGWVPLRVERVFEPSGKISVYAFATLPPAAERLANAVVDAEAAGRDGRPHA